MKNLIRVLGVVFVMTVHSHGQGTIQFNNSIASKVRIVDLGGPRDAPTTFSYNVTVYFALAPGAWMGPTMPLGRSSTTTAGIFTAPGGSFSYAIPGTEPGQVVYMQIYAWDAFRDDPYEAWLAGLWTTSTDVRQVTLGPTDGPGTVIWQSATGTNPNRFNPMTFGPFASPAPPVVPEPSTLALAALGGLMFFARRRPA